MSCLPSPSVANCHYPPVQCDTHCHIFGPARQFPYAANGTYTPDEDALRDTMYALHARLGIERCVNVQAGCTVLITAWWPMKLRQMTATIRASLCAD